MVIKDNHCSINPFKKPRQILPNLFCYVESYVENMGKQFHVKYIKVNLELQNIYS